MPPTRPRPITTIVSIEHDPDARPVECTDSGPRADDPQQRVAVTTPAEPPTLTAGLARALGRIIVKAAVAAEIVGIADATDGHAIAS
jgi:hypothetical protein